MTRALYEGPWRIDVDIRPGVQSPVAGAQLARVVAAGLRAAGAPAPASIGLILSDDPELASLNAEHMGKTGPTDVLSFPLLSPEAYGDGALFPDQPRPPGTRLHLGDIVVSVERAIEQAESGRGGHTGDVRWSPAEELRLLVTHGTLHVCGWDHAEPAEVAAMRSLEQKLLNWT